MMLLHRSTPRGVQSRRMEKTVGVVAGVDLGGTAVNYTLVNDEEKFLLEGLCEHPSLAKQGPEICLQQIADGLAIAVGKAGVKLEDVVAVGLDTPGPASAAGVMSARGSTNFVHANWAGFDIREGLAHKLGKPVSYLNDGNAAALWGHYAIFGANSQETSISTIIGTGNGGGVILARLSQIHRRAEGRLVPPHAEARVISRARAELTGG